MTYEQDKSVGHREYWKTIRGEVRQELPRIDYESLSMAELELLTRPDKTEDIC